MSVSIADLRSLGASKHFAKKFAALARKHEGRYGISGDKMDTFWRLYCEKYGDNMALPRMVTKLFELRGDNVLGLALNICYNARTNTPFNWARLAGDDCDGLLTDIREFHVTQGTLAISGLPWDIIDEMFVLKAKELCLPGSDGVSPLTIRVQGMIRELIANEDTLLDAEEAARLSSVTGARRFVCVLHDTECCNECLSHPHHSARFRHDGEPGTFFLAPAPWRDEDDEDEH